MRAGFCEVDITPGSDISLMGYEFRQDQLPAGNLGVNDPLRARALVLDDGSGKPVSIVALDLCVLTNSLARRLRQTVAEKIETDTSRVILACSHTHSGPFPVTAEDVERRGGSLSKFAGSADTSPDVRYAAELEQRIVEAVSRAAGLTFPVTLGLQQASLGLGYNRRVLTDEGVQHCWGPQECPELPPGRHPDDTLTVAVLAQTAGPRKFILWNHGTHAVTLGKTSRVISADWPGTACGMIDSQTPGARSLFLQGASGNTHPWIATQEDPAALQKVARPAAGMVSLLSEATERPAEGDVTIRSAAETVEFANRKLDLTAWRIGRLTIAAVPVELFAELSAALRDRLDGPLMLATCANGWNGYWAHRQAYQEGGYEVANSPAEPGEGETLIEHVVRLVESC
ncbi:MAG: hypothetical protein ACLFVU_06055 [Phycisphaerae bacterium]